MKNNKNCIGVFDSGLGGLTVLDSLTDAMPNENFVFFGDTAHMPYGTKTKDEITRFVIANVEFLMSFDVKAIVIACNTADSVVREKLLELYDLPIFGVIDPAAKKAATATENNRIGVIATNAAVESGAYERAIKKYDPDAEVTSVACPKLVPLIEEGHFMRGDESVVRALGEYLKPLKEKKIDTLVLGCTHYPLLSETISDMLPGVKLISSSSAVAEVAKAKLEESGMANGAGEKGASRCFVSKNPDEFYKNAKMILGEKLDKIELA